MINKILVHLFVMLVSYFSVCAQKKLVERDLGSDWQEVIGGRITNDGAFVGYISRSDDFNIVTVVCTFTNAKVFVFPGASWFRFTQDSKSIIFWRADSVYFMDLKDGFIAEYIAGIASMQVVNVGKHDDLMLYRLKQRPEVLVVRDIRGKKEQSFPAIDEFWISGDANSLVLECTKIAQEHKIFQLCWLDIKVGIFKPFWKGAKISQLLIGNDGESCIFYVPKGQDTSRNSIWLFNKSDIGAHMVIDDHSVGIAPGLSIGDIMGFNNIDKRIYFKLKKVNPKGLAIANMLPDIWSYKDAKLQSQQLSEMRSSHYESSYAAVCNLQDNRIIQLDSENVRLLTTIDVGRKIDFVLQFQYGKGDIYHEWNWSKDCSVAIYLISLKDGTRRLINKDFGIALQSSYVLSYKGDYVYYYDAATKNYFCYCIGDGSRINLTKGINGHWVNDDYADQPDSAYNIYRFAKILKNSDALLVYDRHDIFKLNPNCGIKAERLTNGASNGRDLVFRVPDFYAEQVVDSSKNILVSAFDRREKKQGLISLPFESLRLSSDVKLEPCSFLSNQTVKARDTDLYLVLRMTAEQSPNLFMTDNFRQYRKISDVASERTYNWLTTELVTWKTFNGTTDQGILYKPENFDSQKKYPVLIYYYERMSDGLHKFIKPGPAEGALNIPYFVSRGYLVFTPDIHYKVGLPGRSACNAIVSGASFLSKRSYVDAKRIGLQGFSFGGFETNFVITHSQIFAAAMSASGMSDFISAYGSIVGDGTSRQRQYELYRDRIGKTLWQRPDLYIENSPVLLADKVTTPLLMMANGQDGDVPVQQGLEFFTALRRLGKKVWMLQYDGQGHWLDNQPLRDDLTDRMLQFYNYYLKGELPPRWMTQGIPAILKGSNTGLELDTSGAKP